MALRLEFAKKYQKKDMRFWGHIIFSDETKVELFPQDRCQRVRRPIHQRFQPKYLAYHSRRKEPSLIFWGAVSIKGQGRLFKVNGSKQERDMLEFWRIVYLQ